MGHGVWGVECEVLISESSIPSSMLRVQRLGFGLLIPGSRVQGFGFQVHSFGM